MNDIAIKLIPAEVTLTPAIQQALYVTDELKVTEDVEMDNGRPVARDLTVLQKEVVGRDWNGAIIQAPAVPAWGFLELKCNVTSRTHRWLMPVVDGHTVHSINQSDLVGLFAKPDVRLVTVNHIRQYELAGSLVFEDREMRTFSKEYATLHLIVVSDDGGSHPVHVFYEGHSGQQLAQTILQNKD